SGGDLGVPGCGSSFLGVHSPVDVVAICTHSAGPGDQDGAVAGNRLGRGRAGLEDLRADSEVIEMGGPQGRAAVHGDKNPRPSGGREIELLLLSGLFPELAVVGAEGHHHVPMALGTQIEGEVTKADSAVGRRPVTLRAPGPGVAAPPRRASRVQAEVGMNVAAAGNRVLIGGEDTGVLRIALVTLPDQDTGAHPACTTVALLVQDAGGNVAIALQGGAHEGHAVGVVPEAVAAAVHLPDPLSAVELGVPIAVVLLSLALGANR